MALLLPAAEICVFRRTWNHGELYHVWSQSGEGAHHQEHHKEDRFLSFGHWTPSRQPPTQSASDALPQSIDLAVAAEELGANGAQFRVHHVGRQPASPYLAFQSLIVAIEA
jgi:hypothetical protein